MNKFSKKVKYFLLWGGLGAIALVITFPLSGQASFRTEQTPDRAVQIAKKSRSRVERSGNNVKMSSQLLFQEFADRTVALQELLDTRKQLEDAGLLDKNDPEGAARRAHLNGKILMEVGKLKKSCDQNLGDLLRALDSFDASVAASLVDSQATRSINTNYELSLSRYMKDEKSRFEKASGSAQKALEAYQDAGDKKEKKRLLQKYNRIKRRLIQVEQRRRLYESRVKVAAMNQRFSGLVREKIRAEGSDISNQFRDLLANLYNVFAKITPVAEIGGTGTPELMANLGFPNVEELRNTLTVVSDATEKLGGVLDEMVNDVLAGLGEIRVVNTNGISGEVLSVDEEMDFLRQARLNWHE
ncbi:MAG: hypothetical protein J7M09_03385 [Deltaproteobacteria bacterium]|nr:hypothetical protein [Candidatus Tharpella sp.]